ncbi:putative 2-hydroxyacid dehydrogenase YoaD [Abditibacteriota bacterium]|nr:putative 2-hydroxyacid dehydrogenase YoaD [Abditibacteriota bacterium]
MVNLISERSKPVAAFWGQGDGPQSSLGQVFSSSRRQALQERVELLSGVITPANFSEIEPQLREVEVLFGTWGMWRPTQAQLDALPNLKAVFYAAGSVKGFASPFLDRGITVVSAWAANAVPVAEWTLAQILLANKGLHRNERDFAAARNSRGIFHGRGNFGATVSLLGAGQIGRRVIEFLRPFQLDVLVFDPFFSEQSARDLGVKKVELAEAFARGNVVSNHVANVPATIGLFRGEHFAAMPQNATFINTGRGATVRHDEMLRVLQTRPDLTALLDVTDPEPLPANSPFWMLPNVQLTSHIAGSIGDEVVRMADYVIAEFDLWSSGTPLIYAVTPAMLETMA